MPYEKEVRSERAFADVKQNIIVESRKRAAISGVTEVESFDENDAVMLTSAGTLCLHGKNLHVGKLSIETGDVSIEGEIIKVEYDDSVKERSGFFGKLFK